MSDLIFDGKRVDNMGDVMDTARSAARQGRAIDFFVAYSRHTPHAAENLAFGFARYYHDEAAEMYKAYGLSPSYI